MLESTRNVVKADLHLHTVYSDGISRPEEYVLEAIKNNFKIISITDHNTFLGSKRAIEYVKDHVDTKWSIVVIPGAEIRTNIGDVLVYCVDYVSDTAPRDIGQLLDWCRDNNCIAVPAHPLDLTRSGIGILNLCRYPWPAVETYNGGTVIPFINEITSTLAKIMGLPEIGNSDAHHVSALGICYTLVPVELSDSAEFVIEAIVRGLTRPVEALSYRQRVRLKLSIRNLKKRVKEIRSTQETS